MGEACIATCPLISCASTVLVGPRKLASCSASSKDAALLPAVTLYLELGYCLAVLLGLQLRALSCSSEPGPLPPWHMDGVSTEGLTAEAGYAQQQPPPAPASAEARQHPPMAVSRERALPLAAGTG